MTRSHPVSDTMTKGRVSFLQVVFSTNLDVASCDHILTLLSQHVLEATPDLISVWGEPAFLATIWEYNETIILKYTRSIHFHFPTRPRTCLISGPMRLMVHSNGVVFMMSTRRVQDIFWKLSVHKRWLTFSEMVELFFPKWIVSEEDADIPNGLDFFIMPICFLC